MDLLVVVDRLEYSFFLSIIPDDTEEIIALDVGKPHYSPVFIRLLLFLIDRIQMKVQLGASSEAQIQLLPLNNNLPLPGEIVLRGEQHFLIKLNLGRYLNLILIAGTDLKMLLLACQYNFIFDIFLLILIDDQTQILSRYLVT